jgi:hypothetical protein
MSHAIQIRQTGGLPATERAMGGALQALMDDGGQVTMGAVDAIPAAAIASMSQGMLAGLTRRNGESWNELLLRLDEAVMQSVVENRVMSDLRV